jgi:hypothetical protein
MIVNVRIYQIQPFDSNDLYLSSTICSATIYLRAFNSLSMAQQIPYFLGQYSTTIDRDSVFKNVPLLKVDAVSMNPKNFLPVSYSIISDNADLFVVDSVQGFLYSRYDLGLKAKTYIVQVKELNFNFNFLN